MIPDFKVGDRVYDIQYGWGTITAKRETFEDPNYIWVVTFENGDTDDYTIEGKYNTTVRYRSLSFTEYDFVNGGFSQERPIDYEEYIGKWGKFWNDKKEYIVSKLERYSSEGFRTTTSIALYKFFEPLTEEQIKILNLE
mgnify:FL=1